MNKIEKQIENLSEEVYNKGRSFIVNYNQLTFVVTASTKETALKKLFSHQKSRISQKNYSDFIKKQKPKIKEANSQGGVIEVK